MSYSLLVLLNITSMLFISVTELLLEDFKDTEVDVQFASGGIWSAVTQQDELTLIEKYKKQMADIHVEEGKWFVDNTHLVVSLKLPRHVYKCSRVLNKATMIIESRKFFSMPGNVNGGIWHANNQVLFRILFWLECKEC